MNEPRSTATRLIDLAPSDSAESGVARSRSGGARSLSRSKFGKSGDARFRTRSRSGTARSQSGGARLDPIWRYQIRPDLEPPDCGDLAHPDRPGLASPDWNDLAPPRSARSGIPRSVRSGTPRSDPIWHPQIGPIWCRQTEAIWPRQTRPDLAPPDSAPSLSFTTKVLPLGVLSGDPRSDPIW